MSYVRGNTQTHLITTTPKPVPLLLNLIERDDVIVTTGDTFENEDNLAKSALDMMRSRYEGTSLGRQELYAEILEDVEGSLWTHRMIEDGRTEEESELTNIIVAIDPAVTNNEDSDET